MKRFDNIPTINNMIAVPLKYLVVAMASMIAMPISQADVADKKIGDLEIYKAAESGKTTITMMLDTSGSMTLNQVNYACDLPGGATFSAVGAEWSNTNPQYIRNFCSNNARYFYRLDVNDKNQWYRCGGSNGSGSSNYSFNDCDSKLSKAPSTVGYDYITSSSGNQYYFTGEKVYDRLTRLKDAIFTLMNSTQLDPKKVAIGIGQFSSQSGSDNIVEFNANGTAKNADGSSGKILLPAALLDETQRQKIRQVVAAAAGGGGTPTANAYAEVGAYMLGTKTSGTGSGFSKSTISSKSNSGSNYISPLLKPSSCDGRGIYFLTDGAPNNSEKPLDLMKLALNRSNFSKSNDTLPSGSGNNNGMPEVGSFAKALRDSTVSPLGTDQEIYTAVVGFGSDFDVDRVEDAAKPESQRVIRNLPYTNPKTGVISNRDFYNCANIVGKDNDATKDARNACNWGEKAHPSLPGVGGFGEGGFYSAQSTNDIVNSIISFVTDLDNTLPSTPSGTIIIPDDPYRADSQLAVAYYPTLQPKVGDNSVVWEGNMKKYKLNEGTLFGKGGSKLFKNIAGELNPVTPDFWSDQDYLNKNDKVESGGFYAQLKTPVNGVTSVRALYVEDWKSATDQSTVLRKVGVNIAGKMTVDNNVLTDTTFKDTNTYSPATLRKLLNFLGFDVLPATGTAVKDMTLSTANVSKAIKVLGATIHSTPAAVSYSATLDPTTGRVTDTRDDYVLFGSSEGGLHLVDAGDQGTGDGGKEKFVIIPREMLRDASKSDALIKDAKKAEIGSPNFGIDAPWLVTADYKYDLSNNRVNVNKTGGKGVFAYGGLRMGGEAFYGLNLNDSDNPSMMFTITPATAGFSRMGQIWSKPTKAKIKTSNTDTGTDVLVFGGGYDMCYEKETFQVGVIDAQLLSSCSNISSTKGNSVYIINAKTGALIWSASNVSNSTGASNTVSAMTNSVVAGVTTLDRDNDGFMDHMYFADLGGQIFRADFTNAGFIKPVTTGTASAETSFTNTRVTRVLKSAYTGTDKKYNYRFYERPVVSFYRNDTTNRLFALVNAISGDRSSPLSKIRDNTKADRLYGIIDSDVTKANSVFYASNFTTTGTSGGQEIMDLEANNTASSHLAELPSTLGSSTATEYTLAQKNAAINIQKAGTKKGWYYPLTRFDGYGNVRYGKGIGKSEVVDSFIYTTVYNPDMSYGDVDSCSAKVTGGSERQLYCLPYGICTDDASKNGTGGYVQAGKGIQELTLGPRSSSLSNQRLLIGTRTLTERANDRVNFGSDNGKGLFNALTNPKGLNQSNLVATDSSIGNGTAPDMIFNERFTLQPKTWYEVD
ncbi:pilus assembly protein PilY [Psychrobacter cryohalolentis]|uniref:Pilus assembly protein tip-associated adhesin PilY1 n=2 Tax=Psychrobacter TaxID=497 RepID=Q1QE53_PSYCK|nr:pilus assembly protein PilY [Psychrobacter cryohalolentis]ABE74050.1 putative pilus assembly protein tip-associated adhesin PilY1 [Psychrobacter cryohalolentis K5]ASE26685.1 pilus assembly protein PilY [Psychrobacter cryohalolentis]